MLKVIELYTFYSYIYNDSLYMCLEKINTKSI